jgi:hypothetical protein
MMLLGDFSTLFESLYVLSYDAFSVYPELLTKELVDGDMPP